MNYRKVKKISEERNTKLIRTIAIIYGSVIVGYFVVLYALLTYFLSRETIDLIKSYISWS